MRRYLALLLALLPACAATEVEWERIEDAHFVAEDGSYSLELPVGWMRSENTLTRAGWDSQMISFNAGPVLESDGGAIDPAAPELLIALEDELAAQPGVRVIECRPVTLDALPAFRMHFVQEEPADSAEESPAGSTEIVLYGAVEGVTLFAFSLEHHDPPTFAQDLRVFEGLVASFKRLRPGS